MSRKQFFSADSGCEKYNKTPYAHLIHVFLYYIPIIQHTWRLSTMREPTQPMEYYSRILLISDKTSRKKFLSAKELLHCLGFLSANQNFKRHLGYCIRKFSGDSVFSDLEWLQKWRHVAWKHILNVKISIQYHILNVSAGTRPRWGSYPRASPLSDLEMSVSRHTLRPYSRTLATPVIIYSVVY